MGMPPVSPYRFATSYLSHRYSKRYHIKLDFSLIIAPSRFKYPKKLMEDAAMGRYVFPVGERCVPLTDRQVDAPSGRPLANPGDRPHTNKKPWLITGAFATYYLSSQYSIRYRIGPAFL